MKKILGSKEFDIQKSLGSLGTKGLTWSDLRDLIETFPDWIMNYPIAVKCLDDEIHELSPAVIRSEWDDVLIMGELYLQIKDR